MAMKEFFSREIPNTLDWTGRFRLGCGVVICYALFWQTSRWAGIPPLRGMDVSLLAMPNPILVVAIVAVAVVLATLAGRLIVGDLLIGTEIQIEGGLVAALLGTVALCRRGGPLRYVLFQMDDHPSVYLMLAGELLLLFAIAGVAWLALLGFESLFRKGDESQPPSGEPDGISTGLMATGTHALVMAACMVFLAASDAEQQTLAAALISSLLASMAAHVAFPVRSPFWFWISPLIVGVVGYTIAFFNPIGLPIGFPDGPLAGLARVAPLDYAGAGAAGAIMGFWIGHRWHIEQAQQAATA
jgi:hypothetical protein